MQFPIVIGLRRSRFMDCALAGLTGGALLVAAGVPWPPEISLALAAAVLPLALHAVRHLAPPFDRLRIDADGKTAGRPPGRSAFVPLRLLPWATVHPWLTVLRLGGENRDYRLLIAIDSAAPEEFRRLRVCLRWRAGINDGAGGS